MKEPEVTLQLALDHGLNEEEYQKILSLLGRVPTFTELGIYSVMWSEHCSYKNSIAELKKLPRTGKSLLVAAGEENAGLVDIGDGLAIAFKIESHNHPSAVEPHQGAATGVGGIMRDIFTMGARPIASLNSLRFGSLDHPRTRYLVKGVVKGIGDYGNSFGVPTVGGEVYFDECYNENPLVNAMSVGIVEHGKVARAIAEGKGNSVMIVGSSTGRDGIHGATFASEEISEKSESRRPAVQVGDPFTEKLLLEATLEAIGRGLIVGIQDMGAAGISCSTSEMSAKSGSGMAVDIDRVPLRETDMSAYEIMLSESQERMLVVVKPEHEEDVKEIFKKWDLSCSRIGEVTGSSKLEVRHHGKLVAEVPAESLVLGGGAPVYHRESKEPSYIQDLRRFDQESLPQPADYTECLLKLLESPNISSRNWIFTQYDSMVRTNTITSTGDAAVVRLKGTKKAIALSTDCNSRYVYLNPFRGGEIAVAESARNVVVSGARPLAITNCLNFGNPYKPEIFWQFKEALRGMSAACEMFQTPVTGGNVSFYNEGQSGAVYPTPVIGMLGLLDSLDMVTTPDFKKAGDLIILLGVNHGHLGGSEYLKTRFNLVAGDAPEIDLKFEKQLQDCALDLIRAGLVKSAHDISEGGLAVALAECCIHTTGDGEKLGARITIDMGGKGSRADGVLFGEDQSRILISTGSDKLDDVSRRCKAAGIPVSVLGEVTRNSIQINNLISIETHQASSRYTNSLRERIEAA
ncbi:MAG TPA: phosphoribosylformylglycinamidine synthase subunit PurL [Bacteroidota bacterium]|nr:phosphoribosylformylglycinamidine synthase subunit PurL [Bacteroidota bacterium]